MNCVIEAMALRSRLKTGMLIMSAVEESSRKRGEERRGASKEGILNCRSKNTVYYFSYVTCYIFGYSHWRSRSLQKESIQSTEDIDPIHPNPIHPNPLQRPSNPITSLQVLHVDKNGQITSEPTTEFEGVSDGSQLSWLTEGKRSDEPKHW